MLALQTERDVVEYGSVVEAGVVLENHAAIRARRCYWLALDEDIPVGRRMLRFQAGDQSQDGALATAAGAKHTDKFALLGQVLNGERHVPDCCELVRATDAVRLRDVLELNDVVRSRRVRRHHVDQADMFGSGVARSLARPPGFSRDRRTVGPIRFVRKCRDVQWIRHARYSLPGAGGCAVVVALMPGPFRRSSRHLRSSQRPKTKPTAWASTPWPP